MPEYDVTLTFTFEANDQADADETVGGIMSHIVDRTDCRAVGGKMTEAARSSCAKQDRERNLKANLRHG